MTDETRWILTIRVRWKKDLVRATGGLPQSSKLETV